MFEKDEREQGTQNFIMSGQSSYADSYGKDHDGLGTQNYYYNSTSDYSGNGTGNYTTGTPAPKKNRGGRKFASFVAKAAVFGVVAGAAFAGVNAAVGNFENSSGNVEAPRIEATVTASNSSVVTVSDVSDIVEQAMPSIVSVVSRVSSNVTYGPFYMGTQEYDSSGSGIVVGQNDTELLIVTNNHVIESASTISITFSDETPADQTDDISVDAVLKGTSAENDLAVVAIPLESIPEEVMSYIKVATLGDSSGLRVGEGTIAIGNALGYGQSVTTGVVSALNREVKVDNISYHAIQTDAAINGGNSGGALLNMKGEVVGINSAKYSSTGVEGMGYAIPISDAVEIINELMNRETRTVVDTAERGYLGITAVNTASSYASAYGIPDGVCVQSVEEGSAAAEAGIQQYDIITKFDGISVSSMLELKELMQYYKAGETITVTIEYAEGRNQYTESEVTVTLGSAPQMASAE